MFLAEFSTEQAGQMLLAFIRTLSLCLTLPKFAAGSYLVFYRILIAGVICLTTAPLIIDSASVVDQSIENASDFFSLAIGEVSIGLALGIGASCVVLALHSAGQIVSQFLGLQIGSLQQGLSPDESSDYRILFFDVGIMFWFSIGGHRLAVEGLLQSFQRFPVGQMHFSQSLFDLVNQLLTTCLQFTIRFSLPIVVVGLIGFFVAGFSSKILGAGQTVAFSFGFNQVLAYLILPAMMILFFNQMFDGTTSQIETVIEVLARQQGK